MLHPYRPMPERRRDSFVRLTATLSVRETQIVRIEDGEIVLKYGHRVPLTADNEPVVREALE